MSDLPHNKKFGLLDERRSTKRIVEPDEANKNQRKHANQKTFGEKAAGALRIASKYNQVVLKVVSFGRSSASVSRQLKYISRNSDLQLELGDGSLIATDKERKELVNTWKDLYFSERKNARNTGHIVLSAPPKTDRDVFENVVREFLKETFAHNHEYAFVRHDDTEHPHVHAILCLQGFRGKKLDIRKAELKTWRADLAKKCREHGIMLDASRRFERGYSGKSANSKMEQMRKKRGVVPKSDIAMVKRVYSENNSKKMQIDTSKLAREKRHSAVKESYQKVANSLLQSSDEMSIKAGGIIKKFLDNFTQKSTRYEKVKTRLQEKKLEQEVDLEY